MYQDETSYVIDPRWVFRAYAILAGVTGFVLFGWGMVWLGSDLPADPYGKAALIRVFGAILMAAALCAMPFALHGRPTLRRGLFWLAAAHFVVFGVLLFQQSAVWGPGIGKLAANVVGFSAVVLFLAYGAGECKETSAGDILSLFSGARPRSTVELRSQYELKIREAARQEERNRLARDLHDSIKQQVFVIQTATATAQARFDNDPSGAKQALEQVRDSSREAMAEMQAMLDQLRAVPLENSGLIETIKRQGDALSIRTGARVEFTLGHLPANETMAPGAHEAILRVAQEALANIGRHARASKVRVSLGSAAGQVKLTIEDDGAGFDPNQGIRGQGLGNMRARAAEFGGTFELTTQPSKGTSLALSIPYATGRTPKERRRRAAVQAVLMIAVIPIVAWLPPAALNIGGMVAVVLVARFLGTIFRARRHREPVQ